MPLSFETLKMAGSRRFRRSLLDRLLIADGDEANGLTLTYSLEQLRESVARDVEALLNSRSAIDFEQLNDMPQTRKSVYCFGIRDFVGLLLKNSKDQRHIAVSLSHAIGAFEPRLRDVQVDFYEKPGTISSLSFTIRAMLLAYPSAEPVAFDAVLQPTLSRFSVAPSRFVSGSPK